MKSTHTIAITADDGTPFATAAECKAYEELAELVELLSGLDASQVRNALDRTAPAFADAFERVGSIIANKRRESGELKRVKKATKTPGDDTEAAFANVTKAMEAGRPAAPSGLPGK